MKDRAMSLIRHGYAVRSRRGFLDALCSALLALALLYPGATTAQEVKQIKLTDKHIQGLMAAYEDIAKLYDEASSDKPEDPKVEAQAAAVAKKHGFASLAQYDDVSMNITMIMSGIDPQTKKFTEPPDQIKSEIAALKADKSVPEEEKKEDLAQLEAALKSAPRMLHDLQDFAKRGVAIVVFNLLRERCHDRFTNPQIPAEMLLKPATQISSQ